MFNIRKLTLNIVLVTSVLVLANYSLSANSEDSSVQSESKTTSTETLIKAQEEMDRLLRQIDEQQEIYNKRPRRKFAGAKNNYSVATAYVENWQKKVEKIGNDNYPKAAADGHFYGKVQATVSIMSDGTVEEVNINKSSGHKLLDDSVIQIVKKAAPYEKFSDELKKYCDIISISRTWTFTQEDVQAGGELTTKSAKDNIGDK